MKNLKYLILVTLIIIVSVSCRRDKSSVVKPENSSNIIAANIQEGIVKYRIKLNIPTKKDAGLFEKIVSGAIESFVESIDPEISLRFKDKKASLYLSNINAISNDIEIDNILTGIKFFDFNKGQEITLEENDSEKIAKIRHYETNKYDLLDLDDTMLILGYKCKHSLLIDRLDKDTISIWYTPKLKVPLSPFEYTGLSGLALELSISAFSLRATEVLNVNQADSLFEIPEGYIQELD